MQDLFNKLRPVLSKRSPDLRELQALRFEVAEARASILQELLELRPKRLRPKDKEWTDLDRKVEMEGYCAALEHNKQFLDDIWVIMNDAIILGNDS